MEFIAIAVETTHAGIEPVTGRLYTLGITGVEIADRADFDEFAAENGQSWGLIDKSIELALPENAVVKAYVADNASGRETLALIRKSLEELAALDGEHAFGSLKVTVSGTSEEDWADGWKKYYKPTRIGRHVVIVPEWEDYAAAGDDIVVKMNPGAAFGTGTHESTRLCAEYIEEFVTKNTRLLDIGTGSGILAVTALKLGARSALGIDIDELAAKVAGENAALNGVEDRLTARQGNLAENVYGTFSLITANIVADVIMALAPDVPDHLSPGGIFVASGIINDREQEVRGRLAECGLRVFNSKSQKNWVSLACRRK